MKKMGFVVLFLMGLLLLAGCQDQKQTLRIEVRDISGEVMIDEEITYPDTTELSLIEVIDEHVDLDYEMSTFGAFIKGVDGFYPTEFGITYNYWLSIYVNDQMIETGLDQVTYEEDMVISFRESSMLSDVDQEIDQFIYGFLDEKVNTYINQDGMDHYVLAALNQLSIYGYNTIDLTELDYPDYDDQTVANRFKKALVSFSKDLDNELETDFSTFVELTPDGLYETITYLNAFDVFYTNENHDKRNEIIQDFILEIPEYMDADFAGMALSAVSSLQENQAVETYIQQMIDVIKDNMTSTGVIGWGGANAASTAVSIIGLLAVGENPRDEEYSTLESDLVESLMLYVNEFAFNHLIDDENPDLAFTTPQGFAALVMYKIYRDHMTTISDPTLNLWVFEVIN